MTSIQDILGCLNHHNIRATYGAVGEVLGIPAFDVGSHLGERRKDASWVVSASSGKPSGYKPSDCHPALFENPKVIRRGEELQKLVKLFTTSKFETGPSATGDVQVAGIDLAWISEKNGSGIAIGSLSESRLTVQQLISDARGLADIQSCLTSCSNLQGVAVDAPLIIRNVNGARPCEKALDAVYRSRWAGCYPSNLTRYKDSSGLALSTWLHGRGMEHLGDREKTPWQIECYPHPAIINIFGLPKRLKYKKGSLEEKQQGQVILASHIRSLESFSQLSLTVPSHLDKHLDEAHIGSLTGGKLKSNEDALDALVCLYIAGLYATGIEMTVFGNTESGYIVVPS